MSNSDDGFPNGGNGADAQNGSDAAEDEKKSGLSVPRPTKRGTHDKGLDIDLDEVDFDSLFETKGKSKKTGPPPRAPKLPPPLTKTPDRPASEGSSKPDPPPPPRVQHKTLMGLGVGRDLEEAGAGASATSPREQFDDEKTQLHKGGAKSPPLPQTETLAESGDNPFSDLDDLADLADFDAEKTNVAESPLIFPEDMKDGLGEESSSVSTDDLEQGDKTEVGMSLEEMMQEHAPEEPRITRDSFDEAASPNPTPPGPLPDNFGFSNFDPNDHSTDSSLLPSPIEPGALPGEAEAGGEFEGEKTELLDSPFTNEPLTARIHVLDGPCAGQEFFVNNLRNTLGRATNNTIVVADVAMSRQHLEIVSNGDGTYVLRDLQSVNGTALNGTRIREGDLFHGDRFEAGKSVFQFVLAGANIPPVANRRVVPAAMQTGPAGLHTGTAPPVAQAPIQAQKRREDNSSSLMTKIAIAAGVVSMALVLGVGILWVQKQRSNQQGEQPAASEGTTASSLYLEGVESVKARDWDEAERSFQKARMMDPEIAGVEAQLERISKEKGYQRLLESARGMLDDGKRSVAVERISDIPRESVYYEQGQALLRENKKLTVDELYTQAVAAFGRDDFDLAGEKIGEIREIVPEHNGATELEERIADAQESAEEEEVAAKDDAPARQRRRRRPSKKKATDDWGFGIEPSGGGSSGGSSSTIVDFKRGYSLYRSKKFGAARSFFDDKASSSDGTWARKAADARDDISKFEKAYNAGTAAYTSKKWSTAERQFLSARRHDKAVATAGYFNEELGKKIANAKAKLGSQELASGDYDAAYKYARDARNYDSGSRELRDLNTALSRKAKALYVQAANSRKTDPNQAAKLCRNIMSMTPSSDDTHKKAKSLLEEL